MKKIVILMMLLCVVFTGCSTKESVSGKMISVNDVKGIIDNYKEYPNVYIIDVREKEEYETGHLKNSINIPLSILSTIELDKEAKIVVYCQSGRRSALALSQLKELGYKNVYDMGGINNWPYDVVDK